MKKNLLTMATLALLAVPSMAQGVYQIPNSDFETWGDTNEPGSGWYSFVSASGTGLALSSGKDKTKGNTTKVAGFGGGSATQIISSWVGVLFIGANANGNLTTGRIYMGSTTPASADNYNYSDINGSNCCKFAGRPDSLSFYAKFKSGGTNNAQGNFILHGNVEYKDPYATTEMEQIYKIAQAKSEITPCTEWTRFSKAFEYTTNSDNTMYMLGSFTTNPVPGESRGDELCIDDVKMIYNSSLKNLSVSGFDKNVYSYEANVPYDESALSYEVDGQSATVERNYDETTGICTITVKGGDISVNPENVHVYTVQYDNSVTTTYNDDLYITMGDQTAEPQKQDILVKTNGTDKCVMSIEDFVLGTGADAALIGDIVLNDVQMTTGEGGRTTYTTNQTINITSENPEALGIYLGNVPVEVTAESFNGKLTAIITINMEGIGQIVVTYGMLPTKIQTATGQVSATEKVYTIDGRVAKVGQKGLLIKNGKKVVR